MANELEPTVEHAHLQSRSANARRLAAEAVGTFFLVFIGPGSVMVNAYSGGAVGPVGIALAFAFVVIAVIYALGYLSGAHINPAVILAFWSVRRFPAAEVIPYLLAQRTGGPWRPMIASRRVSLQSRWASRWDSAR